LCAITGALVRGMYNNIFTQVGFVVPTGLACKNAILIVEFTRVRQLEGATPFDEAADVVRLGGAYGVTQFGSLTTPVFFYIIGRGFRQKASSRLPAEGPERGGLAISCVEGAVL
jgi:hypothetical protein